MKKTLFLGWIFVALMTWAQTAAAVTVRYALVVGNNSGVDAKGIAPFPPLKHAEEEAKKLRKKLIELGNFDPDPNRTVLLLGTTRAQVWRAVTAIKARKAQDARSLGRVDSLFAFFFTGHGLSGRLLLNDGPLTASDLGKIFQTIGADFNISMFDACYSGSLDPASLSNKGIEPTPGLNLFRELPEEVLTAEGSVWFVSSGPDQPSFEDVRLGGVFTHFFMEAMERANPDGPGITLDSIWNYARNSTVDYTAQRKRRQLPQQYVAKLKSTGPVYFSFPLERNATLVLANSVEGQFVLSYAGGQLTERIEKKRGESRSLAVYPGTAQLMLFKAGQVQVQEQLELEPNSTVVVRANPDPPPEGQLGYDHQDLWEKGADLENLRATAILPGPSVSIGAGYEFWYFPQGILVPKHLAFLQVRLDLGGWVVGGRLGYGGDKQSFDAWGYQLNALVGELQAGWGWDLGSTRLTLAGSLGLGSLWENYENGDERHGWLLQPAGMVSFLFPKDSPFLVEIYVRGGGSWAPGSAVDSQMRFVEFIGAGATLMVSF